MVDTFQFGPQAGTTGGERGSYAAGGAAAGASAPEMPSAAAVEYPEEEINPEDIPF